MHCNRKVNGVRLRDVYERVKYHRTRPAFGNKISISMTNAFGNEKERKDKVYNFICII